MEALHFKFTNRATLKQRQAVLGVIDEHKARVRAQFPGDKDKELATVHVVEGGAAAIKKLASALGDMSGVEYAEKRPKRKLIG